MKPSGLDLQVLIQLRKFAEKVQLNRNKPAAAKESQPAQESASPVSGKRLSFDSDVSQLLSTDMTGLDTSIAGALILRPPNIRLVAHSEVYAKVVEHAPADVSSGFHRPTFFRCYVLCLIHTHVLSVQVW